MARSQYEWGLVSDKKLLKGKYSITDIISFVVTGIVLLIAVNIFMENYELLYYFGIDQSKAAPVGISLVVIGILNFLSAQDVLEDFFNTLLRLAVPFLVIYAFGGNVDRLKNQYSGYVNTYTNSYGYSGNTYQQMANVPDQKPEPSNPSNPNKQKWMIIGTNQGLRQLSNLTAEGMGWCKTKAATETNQGRLHCNTGLIWSKNEWSQKNDTF